MRIGPRSELTMGGLRTSLVARDLHTAAGILGSTDLRALFASQNALEGFFCSLEDHSNIVPSSRRFKNDKSLDYD